MTLSEAINQARLTQRSQTFVFASKAKELVLKLEWITRYYGNHPMTELIEMRNQGWN